MDIVDISKIEIAGNGKLVVVPSTNPSSTFSMIYRADMGIEWDDDIKGFISPLPGNISHAGWFGQIHNAVSSEMGVKLQITQSTKFENVSAELRDSIEHFSGA